MDAASFIIGIAVGLAIAQMLNPLIFQEKMKIRCMGCRKKKSRHKE